MWKVLLTDSTGFLIGFLKGDLSIRFAEGDLISLGNFKMKNGQAVIHNNTSITQ